MKITTENGTWMNINEANPDFVDTREHWVEYARNAGAEVADDAAVAVFLPDDEEDSPLYAIEDFNDFVFSTDDDEDLFVPDNRDDLIAYVNQALERVALLRGENADKVLERIYRGEKTEEELLAAAVKAGEAEGLTYADFDACEDIQEISVINCEAFLIKRGGKALVKQVLADVSAAGRQILAGDMLLLPTAADDFKLVHFGRLTLALSEREYRAAYLKAARNEAEWAELKAAGEVIHE